MSSPIREWLGPPLTSSSATAKISPRAASTTGVPVMPTCGSMFPQGRSSDGTAVPTWVDHRTAPVLAASAYTVSFSVATKTRPVASTGSP